MERGRKVQEAVCLRDVIDSRERFVETGKELIS